MGGLPMWINGEMTIKLNPRVSQVRESGTGNLNLSAVRSRDTADLSLVIGFMRLPHIFHSPQYVRRCLGVHGIN
ncbi:hypothetical protein KFK09_017304 [Dendrobium nobile]|uniref:Uncharacterized protein n=1 Tax=Dendrobium nobile TaxID=94219 RepID=A0A8T3B0M7_DENNO|nr:hypothetical protein KFK09_017304 [Dendrobium nobile]